MVEELSFCNVSASKAGCYDLKQNVHGGSGTGLKVKRLVKDLVLIPGGQVEADAVAEADLQERELGQ